MELYFSFYRLFFSINPKKSVNFASNWFPPPSETFFSFSSKKVERKTLFDKFAASISPTE